MATSLGVNGLIYPASQGADSDANVMDDYEEGTWTPNKVAVYGFSDNTEVLTGKYVKIGILVYLSFILDSFVVKIEVLNPLFLKTIPTIKS